MDVLDRLSYKLISRHPHVFGDVQADTPAEVLKNWEALKSREKEEKEKKPKLLLDSVSRAMPALLEASKISHKAAGVGFDWPNIEGLFEKLEEETRELKHELETAGLEQIHPKHRGIAGSKGSTVSPEVHERLEDEVGDLFFVLVNIARYLGVDAESALRKSNAKFRRRFNEVEETLSSEGKKLEDSSLEEMEQLWQQAKQSESRR
jgi:uncharacterized protein YabN with tetrapyrrole methylase and pyrophosphatase domain